ncbi:uncharacterized protein [Mytilus edulis]|uniref:uncharacterized protein n=1 Tax=Mytilus edulis TaxID=6550 RepID=UPI0039EF0E2C
MEEQTCKIHGNGNGDCSEDDLFKGSDDAVNVVKSPKHSFTIPSVLLNKIKLICICTVISVIGIVFTVVLSVTMLVIVSTDDKQNGFLTAILKISNQLDSLSIKTKSESSITDGTQSCKNINTSYPYYALQAENRKLRAKLQKPKSTKDDQTNILHLTKDISRISNQLESLSTKMNSYSSATDGSQTCENINTNYLYYVIQEENRRLKDELKITKSRKNTDNKRNKQEERKKLLQVDCGSVSCAHNSYRWVVANRSLSFGRSDHFDIIIQFKLFYPEIPDYGKLLFEFGLTTLAEDLTFNNPAIIVRGQRCEKVPGMCFYVIDDVLTKLEGHVFEQMSDYIQGQLTLELHKSYFVLMSNQKNIYISNMLNFSSKVELWPVFGFYNTHLINVSQTILSENKISFNRTTVDPHFFVSEDNSTISSCKLWPKETGCTRWDISIIAIEITYFLVFTILCFRFNFCQSSINEFVRILDDIAFFTSCFLCVPLSLYYLYMNWSIHLLFVVSTLLGLILYNLEYQTIKNDPKRYVCLTFPYSTYIVILFKMFRYIFYLIFF